VTISKFEAVELVGLLVLCCSVAGIGHATARLGRAGDGVLFFDVGGPDGTGDGKLTSADADFSKFKIMVTNADGSQTAKTLAELGIVSINLNADATLITLPDGSQITGTAVFTRGDGSTGTVADTILVAEADGNRVTQDATIASNGTRTVVSKGYDGTGALSWSMTSITSANGRSIANSYDDNGDGVVDRIQTITTTVNTSTGARTETLTNKLGNDADTAVTLNKTVTITSADGKTITINRDTRGGGWNDQTETRTENPDGSHSNVIKTLAPDGTTVITSSTETLSTNGLVRTELLDQDGDGDTDARMVTSIATSGDVKTTRHATYNDDGSIRVYEKEVIAANGRDKVISRDSEGNGVYETIETLTVTLHADGSRTSALEVTNTDGSLRAHTLYTQSEDTLSRTILENLDGDLKADGTQDVDQKTVRASDGVIELNLDSQAECHVI
jgi:hypothetical protein